ncbi:MAG: coenzyme F420-0:L-glutamate ligase [Oscillospiraceae bacterium]|jgi:F420-0:gamma-glutamyl ligase|nr:coenzyme F420-0:L-glutamate ligase [Oscillospiraceae bacterium]
MDLTANEGKLLEREIDGVSYARIPVRTHVITDADTIADVLEQYVRPLLQEGDIVFISEKAVACTQKRAIPMEDIHPTWLARTLCKFVYKNPFGIGLSIPETMQCALDECGRLRILFAAFISVIGKIIGKRGWFYQLAGEKARGIDGPCDCTLPPYNHYVVLTPEDPEKVAANCAEQLGTAFAVVDANDLGVNILGTSPDAPPKDTVAEMIRDNPLGQSAQQTPIGIIRKAQNDT